MWSISKTLQIPLHNSIKDVRDIPHTISYVIRKRQQIDNLMELPKEKRPPDYLIWHNNPDRLEEWLNEKLTTRKKKEPTGNFYIPHKDDIE